MKKLLIIVLALVISATTSISQIAINEDNSNPDASAILDLKSTNKGLLIPRVTLNDAATADPVANPAEGLIIFNIDGTEEKGIYYWTGNRWQLSVRTGSCDVLGNPSIVGQANSTSTTVSVCEGSSLSLSSNDNGFWNASSATYSWTGPNSYSSTLADPGVVTANFNTDIHAGDYIVTIINGVASDCSYSSTITVTGGVSTIPATPGAITGNTTLGGNTTGEPYSIAAVPNAASYNWTVPSDATVTSGQGTTSITVSFGTNDGNVSVRSENGCGNSTYSDLAITLIPTCYNATTEKTWMDRNLGATQVATASDDANAYGDLYQWGRASEGHEIRTSSTSSTLATTATPNQSNTWDSEFIFTGNAPHDWLDTQIDTLWQGVSGTNNPCPNGFRLPTITELHEERQSWSPGNATGAFGSALKMTVGGNRSVNDGSLTNVGSKGYYWSSTVDGIYCEMIYFDAGNSNGGSTYRASGCSIRCIKD